MTQPGKKEDVSLNNYLKALQNQTIHCHLLGGPMSYLQGVLVAFDDEALFLREKSTVRAIMKNAIGYVSPGSDGAIESVAGMY